MTRTIVFWSVGGVLSSIWALILGLVTSYVYDSRARLFDSINGWLNLPQNQDTARGPSGTAKSELVVVPHPDSFALIEVNSTQCQGWVLDSLIDTHPRRRGPLAYTAPLGEVAFARGASLPSLQLQNPAGLKDSLGKVFQELVGTDHVPKDHIFIIADGFLSQDALAGPADAARALEKAVAEVTDNTSLHHGRLVNEIKFKAQNLIPHEQRYQAYLVDVGSDLVGVGWIQEETVRVNGKESSTDRAMARFYPPLGCRKGPKDDDILEHLDDDLDNRHGTLINNTRKTIYCIPSRQKAAGKVGARLLPVTAHFVNREDGEAIWVRPCLDFCQQDRAADRRGASPGGGLACLASPWLLP